MAQYRKKPVIIDAWKLEANCENAICEIINQPSKVYPAYLGGIFIDTLEGTMYARRGDYIIKGVQGEFYPCKPDIFEQTYEAIQKVEE